MFHLNSAMVLLKARTLRQTLFPLNVSCGLYLQGIRSIESTQQYYLASYQQQICRMHAPHLRLSQVHRHQSQRVTQSKGHRQSKSSQGVRSSQGRSSQGVKVKGSQVKGSQVQVKGSKSRGQKSRGQSQGVRPYNFIIFS